MLSTVPEAWTQYNANSAWGTSTAVALLRLEAVEFLISQRGQKMQDAGSDISFESLIEQAQALRRYLGWGPARGQGSRRLAAGGLDRQGPLQ